MARARNIKPSIMDNEELAALPALTRLLFIYMWMLADRDGRLEDRPSRIKKQALGYDDGNADLMLNELAKAGFIERYEVEGAKVIQILAFNKHQTPHVREAASELPTKCESTTKAVPSTNKGGAEPSPRSPDSPFPLPDTPYLIPDTKVESTPRKRDATKKPQIEKPDDVSSQVWQDFQRLRREKRAPLTDTAMAGIRREAVKAGVSMDAALACCCEAGWQGFNAGWYANRCAAADGRAASSETAYQRSMRERIEEVAPSIARKAPGEKHQDAADYFRTIDATSRIVDVPEIGVRT